MTDTTSIPRPSWNPTPRFLWGAVGVLGVIALALGAALVQVQTQKTAEVVAAHTLMEPHELDAAAAVAPAASQALQAPTPPPVATSVPKTAPARVKSNSAAIKKVAKPAASTTDVVTTVPTPQPVPREICLSCGTVTAVTPVQREVAGSGVGAVAGAVLGGLVGNQFGGGDGKTVATVLGAIGGGYAGNTVEKRIKKETVYQVDVRMEDGSVRTIEQATPQAVGARVTVQGDTISPRSADATGAIQ